MEEHSASGHCPAPNVAEFLLTRAAQRKGRSNAMAEISADGDGCIRRRCVDCGKHFASSIEQRDWYWCPYCGVQRSWEYWFTPRQEKYLDDALAEDAFAMADHGPEDVFQPPPRAPLHESTTDLATVPLPCHPTTRLKLVFGWSRVVWCHLCGVQAQLARTALARVRLRRRES